MIRIQMHFLSISFLLSREEAFSEHRLTQLFIDRNEERKKKREYLFLPFSVSYGKPLYYKKIKMEVTHH